MQISLQLPAYLHMTMEGKYIICVQTDIYRSLVVFLFDRL